MGTYVGIVLLHSAAVLLVLVLLPMIAQHAHATPAAGFDNVGLRRAVAEYLADASTAIATYGPIEKWSTWKVTDMSGLFQGATDFNIDISEWDLSSVTTTSYMFAGASSFNAPLTNLDVSSVEDFSFMFTEATSFSGAAIGDWQTSSARTMDQMFRQATSFVGPSNIQQWDVASVTSMEGMFFNASSFNRPVNDWTVSNVKDMNSLFEGASSFDQQVCWNSGMRGSARCIRCFCGTKNAGFADNCNSVHPSTVAYSRSCSNTDILLLEAGTGDRTFERPEENSDIEVASGSTSTALELESDRNSVFGDLSGPLSNEEEEDIEGSGENIAAVTREIPGAGNMKSQLLASSLSAGIALVLLIGRHY